MIDRLAEVCGRPVSRETFELLGAYVALLTEESARQNLVSASTLATMWERHIVDSAQMLRFESRPGATWADIGSGAGLPGIVLACLTEGEVTLIEPRRLRAGFLEAVIDRLRLNARVMPCKAEQASGKYDMICARAVAPMARLLKISRHLSTGNSVWVLPRGKFAQRELAETRRTWQGVFHVERSLTDVESFIVVSRNVKARAE